jgi:DNA-binding MarR family transcriptional regulator
MSSGSQESRARLLRELTRELRQVTGLGASYFRAAAARLGMPVTDLQVIDILDGAGPLTAGQLAELTGLTTGAITGMINRLEKSGLIQRGSDPDDARRVIVRLDSGAEALRDISSTLDSLGTAWSEVVAGYDEERIALLLEVLRRGAAQTRDEIVRLRTAPEGEESAVSAPLGDLPSGELFVIGAPRLVVRAGAKGMADLYQARFEGVPPDVRTKAGAVTIRYPRRFLIGSKRKEEADVTLNSAIPWKIAIHGAAAEIVTELGLLNLAGLEVQGGVSMIQLNLPTPSAVTPVRISGGASEIVVRRPVDAAARVRLKGWVSTFVFDDQTFGATGSDVRLQSRDFAADAPYYDIEVSSAASMVTITAD